MKINVFEGGRRIALVLQVVWVIGCIVVVWQETPYVSFTYETPRPSAPFVKTQECATADAREYRSLYTLEDGKYVNVTLCFRAQPFANGSMLVPYKEDGGQWWGNAPYSSEVMDYTRARANRFTLPEAGRQAALEEWRKGRRSQIWAAIGVAVGGWIAIAVVGTILGWIVRGFFGIPRGKDSRPEPLDQSAAKP